MENGHYCPSLDPLFVKICLSVRENDPCDDHYFADPQKNRILDMNPVGDEKDIDSHQDKSQNQVNGPRNFFYSGFMVFSFFIVCFS